MRPHLASPLSSVCDGDHRMSDLTGALAYKLVRGSEIFPLMSAWGQTRKSALVTAMSAFPPIATKLRTSLVLRIVPQTEVGRPQLLYFEVSCPYHLAQLLDF